MHHLNGLSEIYSRTDQGPGLTSTFSSCPVPTVANVDNNEIRIEKNNSASQILLAFISHYCAFPSSVCPIILYFSPFRGQTSV